MIPGMQILSSIAATIAQYTFAPVGRQFGYVLSYNKNVDNLERELHKLQAAKDVLQHSVEDAERNGEEIFAHVNSWLIKVGDTVANVNRFSNNEGHTRVGCSNGSIPNLWTRHQLSKKAKKMAQGISETIADGKFEKISFRPPLSLNVPAPAREYEALQSRTSILHDVMEAFKDANAHKIGVYGMGGVGKTALVRELAWQAEHDKTFGAVIVATVTNSPNVKKIQGEISDALGLKFDEESQQGRAARLCERIKKEKSILVILDDIWGKLGLTEVGIPFGDQHRGCKLLLTSRDLNVLKSEMGTEKNFKLEVLSQEESWSLFEKKVGAAVEDTNLKPIAIEVANRCAGLPLLILMMARTLKDADLSIWKDALMTLPKVDREGSESQVYSVVELSYNHLRSDELKSFFLFIGSFGKVHAVRDLISYGWGLGLYKRVDTLAHTRNRVYRLIKALRNSCLLLDGERDLIEMHDVIYDVASSIASKVEPFFTVQWFSELKKWPDSLQWCHRILLPICFIQELPEHLECPKLKILVLNNIKEHLKMPNNFLEGMRELKVLDLGGLNFCPSPPRCLSHLTNLKALYLCQCMLEDISVVAKLTSLEILSLERSEIKELPIEIGQLTHLRSLDLSDCLGLTVIPANLISRLICLEDLYMGNCFIQWENEGRKKESSNASLGELRYLRRLNALNLQIRDFAILPRNLLVLRTLECYKILIGDGWKWTWDGYRHYQTTRTLKLNYQGVSADIIHSHHSIRSLLNTVEELYLANIKGPRNVLHQLNREGFLQLKHLDIQNSVDIEYIVDSAEWVDSQKVLPVLETLVLENLSRMKKICHDALSIQSFTNLKVIKVRGCDELKHLFSYSLVENLSQLLNIEISECKSMTEIIVGSRSENDEFNQIIFTKLHSLTLECLPMLVSFCSKPLKLDTDNTNCATESRDRQSAPVAIIDEKVAFPNLETMKLSLINAQKIWDEQLLTQFDVRNLTCLNIDSCRCIKYLFPSSVARGLVKLNYLEISNCQMMEEIFEQEGNIPSVMESLSTEEALFPKLETLVISHMDNLKSVWHNHLATNSFGKVKKVEIKFCNKLLYVFPSHLRNRFRSVETMIVEDCKALEVVFQMQGLNSGGGRHGRQIMQLRTLTLNGLPKLNHVFPLFVATELSHLQVLDVRGCGVENIVAKDEMVEATPRLVFPELTSLILRRLTDLSSFHPGIHTLRCPNLRELDIFHCDKFKLFTSRSQSCQEDSSVEVQYPFSFEKVFRTPTELLSLSSMDVTVLCESQHCDDYLYAVKSLNLRCFHDVLEKVPWGFLQKFVNLEQLTVGCSSFVEIFSNETSDDEYNEVIMKLRSLKFNGLSKMKYICKEEPKMQPILQNLETLEVCHCDSLKSIVPSYVVFQNLNTLWVYRCAGLVTIITSSTAKSFVNLRKLIIQNCEMTEEIVACEDDDAGEITLMKLERLELVDLSRLARFCKGNYNFKFPLLEVLFVTGCPMMETFSRGFISAPSLRRVRVEPQAGGEWCWEGDLNTTITTIFSQRVALSNLETMKLSLINTQKILDEKLLTHSDIRKLRNLTIESCGSIKYLFPFSVARELVKLNYLEISNCQMMEEIFVPGESSVMESLSSEEAIFPNLETLIISHMDSLESVWPNHLPTNSLCKVKKVEIKFCNKVSYVFPFHLLNIFQRVEIMIVEDCIALEGVLQLQGFNSGGGCQLRTLTLDGLPKLNHVFPLFVASELLQLQVLDVRRCGVENIVAKDPEMAEAAPTLVFPQLTSLTLWNLSNLRSFYPEIHTLDCPILRELDVYHCDKLQLFTPKSSSCQENIPVEGQHLVSYKKVFPTPTESLSLSSRDVKIISENKNCDDDLYNVKGLALQCFHDESEKLSWEFLLKFRNLETLVVACSAFEEIFSNETTHDEYNEVIMKLKSIKFNGLRKMKYICKEDFAVQPILQNLETLEVLNCKSLENIVPSSTVFHNLNTLWVYNCPQLVAVITSSTARSFLNLRNLMIQDCEMIEEVVASEDNDVGEMALMKLERLQLWNLPGLACFCKGNYRFKFPSLELLFVAGCPMMETFSRGFISAPNLRGVRVNPKVAGEYRWEGDINTTIRTIFSEKHSVIE